MHKVFLKTRSCAPRKFFSPHVLAELSRSVSLLPVECNPSSDVPGQSLDWESTTSLKPMRDQSSHGELVANLQRQFGIQRQPPEDSVGWSSSLLKRWFRDGGCLTVQALQEMQLSDATCRLIDHVGDHFPVVNLPLEEPNLSLLSMLEKSDESAITRLIRKLSEQGFIACKLGASVISEQTPHLYAALIREGEDAWTQMRPGELHAGGGKVISGRSPSGALRGDRYVLFRR